MQTEQARGWDWDKRQEAGPFDFIGDVHGCFDELVLLLDRLGYDLPPSQVLHDPTSESLIAVSHPEGRRLHFVGDLCDRGPRSKDVLRLVMGAVQTGQALCVMGNHDDKLRRYLRGRNVDISHGLDTTTTELKACSLDFNARVLAFLESLNHYHVFAHGALAVAHAGLRPEYYGRTDGKTRALCLFGPTQGMDDMGRVRRIDWAPSYSGETQILYGHTPVHDLTWRNNTLNLDTGCVFGGYLSALRWPEGDFLHQSALALYAHKPGFTDSETSEF